MLGLQGRVRREVAEAETAVAVGSGDLPVLATPIMIALMEAAACAALAGRLPAGSTSVGTHVDVRHLAPSPVGTPVTAEAIVTAVRGTRVSFEVSATHEMNGQTIEIGRGTHTRVIVRRDDFLPMTPA
jgi:predicted thioesterase